MRLRLLLRVTCIGVTCLLGVLLLVFLLSGNATLLAASRNEGESAEDDEGSGFSAQISARIIGPNDNVNFFFSFHGIKTHVTALTNMRPYTIMKTQHGRMTVSGSSTCTWRDLQCTKTYHNIYNGVADHRERDARDPAFTLELWDQGDDTVRYRFNICINNMEYLIRSKFIKEGPRGCNPGEYAEVHKESLLGIQIGANPSLYKARAAGGSRHLHYLLSIADFNAYEIYKGEKCIMGHKIYDLEPRSRDCPAKVHVAWNILLEEVEVEVEKCDRDWRPEKDGEPAVIKARIVKPEGAAGVFRFKLTDISNEPGYCMNAGDEEDADLAFIWEPDKFDPPEYVETGSDPASDSDGAVSSEEVESDKGVPDEVMETKEAVNSATVKIQPKDYGAYGVLMVEVNFCGIWYPAKVVGEDEYSIDIPLDEDLDHIADGQELWDMGKAPGNTDNDGWPEGDGTPGDGLTNYEEYRGFMVKDRYSGRTEWKATDPEVKNLFVCFSDPSLSWGYFGVTDLELYEVGEDGFNGIDSRVVNYNHKTAHKVDQHGIYMKTAGLTDSFGETAAPLSAGDRWTPKDVIYVKINVDGHETLHDLYCTEAHELGHCVGINHHGDLNEETTLDELMKDPGFSHLSKALEDFDRGEVYDVAVCHGQNSGFEMCFMRYHFADFYKREDGEIYLYPEWDTVMDVLCSTQEGESINREGEPWEEVVSGIKRVFPMSGKATKGNCMGQIRVNDKE